MGLYQDLQDEVIAAFNTDLADATRTINVIQYVETYDEDTMTNTRTPTAIPVRVVKLINKEGEILDDPTLKDIAKFLVMDSEINGAEFYIGMSIVDDSYQYKLEGYSTDPANASWELVCRRLG